MKVENLFFVRSKIVLTILFLGMVRISMAQEYSVVTTKGSILYGAEKIELSRGTKVNLNESLIFQNPDAMAVLIGSSGDRFILKMQESQGRDSELMATIKDVLVPMKRMSALTTRGYEEYKIIDLEAMIGESNFVILGEEMPLVLDEAYYPMDEKRYFVFSYFVGKDAVNKKVYFDGNKLILMPSKLFMKDDVAVDSESIKEVKLFYRDEIKKDTKLISTFRPIVLSTDRLKKECEILISFYSDAGMDNAAIKGEINDYLSSFYGKTSKVAVYAWIEKNFDL